MDMTMYFYRDVNALLFKTIPRSYTSTVRDTYSAAKTIYFIFKSVTYKELAPRLDSNIRSKINQ